MSIKLAIIVVLVVKIGIFYIYFLYLLFVSDDYLIFLFSGILWSSSQRTGDCSV